MAESDSSTSLAEVSAPSIGPNGAVPPSGAGPATAGERRRFDLVIRGDKHSAADEHLARVAEENASAHRDLAESDSRRKLRERHWMATESEVRGLRTAGRPAERSAPDEGFGPPVRATGH